jgi:hypothetical protein
MNHHSDEELWQAGLAAVRRRLVERRGRCLKTAAGLLVPGLVGIVFLCIWGLRPGAVAIPVFLTTISVLFGSISAALFARLAHLELRDLDDGSDEDDHGPGGGSNDGPDPLSGGGLEIDWQHFEREFASYCERAGAIHA